MLKITWTIIGWVLLGIGVSWVLGRLGSVLFPLILGLLIVFFLRPPVEWLVHHKVPRLAAISLCYLLALGVLVGAGFLLAPTIARQADQFVTSVPEYVERLQETFQVYQDRYSETVPEWAVDTIDDALEDAGDEIGTFASGIAGHLLTAGRSVLELGIGFLTGLVIGFYLLYSLPSVGPGILDAMPPGWRRDAREASQRLEETVGGFVRGQVIVMAAVGVLTWLGLWLVGLPYSGFVGVLAGLLDIIPYIGPLLASIVAVIIALFTEPILALWSLIVIIIVQQIETHLVRPKVMSDQVGIHPVIVILAILAGAAVMGFIGMLLAIPVVAIIKALYGFYAERHGWQPW